MSRHYWTALLGAWIASLLFAAAASAAATPPTPTLLQKEATILSEEQRIPVTQATQDLQVQYKAGDIVGHLESALADNFAGVWFDPQAGKFHINIVTPSDKAAADAVISAAGIESDSEISIVRYTWKQLEAAAGSIKTGIKSLLEKQEASVIPSPQTDSVIVEAAANLTESEVTQTKTARVSSTVPTQVVPVQPTKLAVHADAECKFPYCKRPLRGGVRIGSTPDPVKGYAICTSGFYIHDVNNYPYILTAGHCFEGSSVWAGQEWGTANAEGLGCGFGIPVAIRRDSGADGGVISSPGGCGSNEDYIVAWTNPPPAEHYYIWGPVNAYNGLFECHYGQTSEAQCGTVSAANVTTGIQYDSGLTYLEHTDQVCTLSLPGDSGGPWAYGNASSGYATAIDIAGNSKTCAEGGISIGDEITYEMSALGDLKWPNTK